MVSMSLVFRQLLFWWLLLAGLLPVCARASDTLTVAVASNFSAPAKVLMADFEQRTKIDVRLVLASSGKLLAQITQGAPFDVFLSADDEKPAYLVEAGFAEPSSIFTYAVGQVVLWSPVMQDERMLLQRLKNQQFSRLAIANPRLAPYGVAAMEVLTALDLVPAVEPKLVRGENIAQTLQFIASRNVELGFIARSQWLQIQSKKEQNNVGAGWAVPPSLHAPIRQQAVLLKRAESSPAASAFLAFLKSEEARKVIASYGYLTPNDE